MSSAPTRAATQSARVATVQEFDDARAMFRFEDQVGGTAYSSLSPAQRDEFTTEFCRELARPEQWAVALHELARELLQRMVLEFVLGNPMSLDKVRIAELDEIATPAPLELEVGDDFYGEGPRGQGHVYPVTGSSHPVSDRFTRDGKIRALYMRKPLVPLQRNAGLPGRWMDVYGVSLAALEDEWKALIVGAAKR